MDQLRNYDWVGLLEKVLMAAIILLVTWLIAKGVRAGISKLAGRVSFLQRQGRDGQNLGAAIGQIAALLVWLFGLIAILQVFSLSQAVAPITGLLDTVLRYIPNIIGAGVVFFIGLVLAKVARQLVGTALSSFGLDERLAKVGASASAATDPARSGESHLPGTAPAPRGAHEAPAPQGGQPPQGAPAGYDAGGPQGGPAPHGAPAPQGAPAGYGAPQAPARSGGGITDVIANLVFALVLIVVSISALQILGISAISDPATSMLNTVLNALPNVIAAIAVLLIGWFIAKFVAQLLESTLAGVGVDRLAHDQGILPADKKASSILAIVVKVAIVLFFAIMATRLLGFPEITGFLEEVISVGGHVLFGAAFIGAGVLIASVLRRALSGSTAGQIVYWATIALFAAMGLSYMGIAESIVNLAFGAVVVGGALAAALAFGLGGRDAAARTLTRAEKKIDSDSTTPGA